ncbi:MAG TPA: MCP four helix bundle domain-containing protein [Flavobacteriales bacterium]
MKWAYSIKNKITASVLLAVVLGLVLLNNIDERQNSDRLRQAIATMYEDRLVVEGYIFDLSEEVHSIQEAIDEITCARERDEVIAESLSEIKSINAAYAKTTLTPAEEAEFNLFTTSIANLENSLEKEDFQESKRLSKESLALLYNLSEIQLDEANRVKQGSEHILNYGKTSSQFEMAVLIVIAIIIQIIVFASPGMNRVKGRQVAPSLN